MYRSDALGQIPWLEHGFGTRSSAGWPNTTRLATVRQIHSNRVVVADRPGDLGEGDALVTNLPGLTLAVRTADCLPILIADTKSRAVAAVHAGWRGTAQQIVLETLRVMAKEFETISANVVIAIGPGIGPCCYQVGPDVASQFSELFPEIPGFGAAHALLDLPEANLRQLRRNGGINGQIVSSGLCTKCLPDQFHSFRRDKQAAGRMTSAVAIR